MFKVIIHDDADIVTSLPGHECEYDGKTFLVSLFKGKSTLVYGKPTLLNNYFSVFLYVCLICNSLLETNTPIFIFLERKTNKHINHHLINFIYFKEWMTSWTHHNRGSGRPYILKYRVFSCACNGSIMDADEATSIIIDAKVDPAFVRPDFGSRDE